MQKKILSVLLAALVIVMAFSSCNSSKTGSSEDSSKDTSTQDSTTFVSEDKTELTIDTGTQTVTTSSTVNSRKPTASPSTSAKTSSTEKNENKPVKLYVKDFGAKGDGKTDDARAIFQAISALRSSPPGSVLNFEPGKTYYYKNNGTALKALFYFNGDTGLTVNGNNCLIKLGGYDTYYADITECKDLTFEGINLDHAEYKPAFAARLNSINMSTGIAEVTADRSINLENGEVYTPAKRDMFGTIPTPYSRIYLWLIKYEMIDVASRKVRVYFDMKRGQPQFLNDKDLLNQYGLVLPMPKSGFSEGASTDIGFRVNYNTNITFKNINVYSNKYHGFYLMENHGLFTFENVCFIRPPYDQGLRFSSWGDIYHLTSNRAKFIWKGCKNEHPYDDVFNIMAATMSVSEKHSDSEITLIAENSYYGVPKVQPGDLLTIIDKDTGKLVGRPTVKSVVKQEDKRVRVKLNTPLPTLKAGKRVYAWDENTVCDPKSEMINCEMDGTFRARTNITFTNCKFHVRRFWIGLEVTSEGPLPRNILFRNCDLTGDSGTVWHIQSFNNVAGGYHIENIVFENCKGISMDKVLKDPYDEVIIR